MGQYRHLEGADGAIGVESEGFGVGEQVIISSFGQHGG